MRLHDYLGRLGVQPPLDPSVDTLRRLHVAHRETFLFENLTIQTGGTIPLALDSLERKFLDEGRGGYCFEHNTLFAAVLRDLGFSPVTLLGRVRRGPPELWKRTHMVLRVPIDGDSWLADVGFGAVGLLEPIPLLESTHAPQGGLTYSLRRDAGSWVLSMGDVSGATDLYEFTEDPQTAGDVEVANHYTSTHPDSIFRQTLTIQRSGHTERTALKNDAVTRYRDGRMTEESLDPGQWRRTARELFGIELNDGPLVFEK